MSEPVVSEVKREDVRTPEPGLSAPAWRALVANGTFARHACAGVLLAAAVLKTHQIATDPALGVLYGSRWLQVALAEYELLLAVWLLSGVGAVWARRVALLTFAGFGCYAAYLAFSGAASCGCFGQARVNPWWTFTLDVSMVALLLAWKPTPAEPGSRAGSRPAWLTRSLVAVAGLAVATIPLLPLLAVPRLTPAPSHDGVLTGDKFVLLEPAKWVGKPFPLAEHLVTDQRERLSRGSWVLVFVHEDCPKCGKEIPRYERLAETLRVAGEGTDVMLIAVPHGGTREPPASQLCHYACLSEGKEWLITTPCEVRLADGVVIAATTDERAFLTNLRHP
jgi:hypothetical protein